MHDNTNWFVVKILPEAVFFDMDGVLYDSMKNHEITWINSFKAQGIDFSAQQAYLNEGRTGFDTIKLVYRDVLGREATHEECRQVYDEKTRLMALQPKAGIMPGMKRLVDFLRTIGVKVFVVTGSQQPMLLDKLEHDFGFGPQSVISGQDVVKGKPDPEPYLRAVKRSGADVSRCVVIENAPLGIRSAKGAGIYTIALNTGVLADDVLWEQGCDELFPDTLSFSNHWIETLSSIAG